MRNYILLSVLLLFSSCVTTSQFQVEILKPAQITFAEKKPKLLLVDRALIPTKAEINVKMGAQSDKQKYPLVLSGNRYVYDMIRNHPFFSDVRYMHLDSIHDVAEPQLTPQLFSALRDSVGDDFYILSLDSITLINNTSIISEQDVYLCVAPTIELYYKYHFITPDATQKTPYVYHETFTKGSFYCDASGIKNQLNFNELDVLIENISAVVADALTPNIVEEPRSYLVSSNLLMKEGARYMSRFQFDEAMAMWQYILKNERSKKTQALALFNLAVCYEISDDYLSAQKTLQQALSLVGTSNGNKYLYDYFSDYKKLIEKRITDKTLLQKQLGESVGIDNL